MIKTIRYYENDDIKICPIYISLLKNKIKNSEISGFKNNT